MPKRFQLAFLILAFAGSVLFGQACGVVRPSVVNSRGLASMVHSSALKSCNECHESARPLAPIGKYGFNHTDPAYGGMGDCIQCHTNQNYWGSAWNGAQFAHDPQPATCVSCHAFERPTTNVGTPAFSHTLNGQGDCVSCHAQNILSYDSIANWAGGEFFPSQLIGIKNLSLPVKTPTFTGSNLTSVTTSTATLPLQMLHTTDQLPLVDPPAVQFVETCLNCHSGAPAGNFTGGILHASLTAKGVPQPTACLECHTNTMPVGFIGLNDINRSPQSGAMRHEAVAWKDNGAGVWTKSTTKLVTQDCATCHKSPGGSWASANYHANLTTQPTACLDCHSNSRPVGAVGTPLFDHAKNGGSGECTTCHTVTNFASRVGWAGAAFAHTAVTQCATCHEAQRPANSTGWQNVTRPVWSTATTRFDLTKHAKGTDCYSCHSGVLNHNAVSDFKGGTFSHVPRPASCVTCHAYPTGAVGSPATDHAGFGGQDCAGCHTTNSTFANLTGWAGASSTPTGLVNGDTSLFSWTFWTVNPITITKTGNVVKTATQTNGVKLPQQMNHYSSNVMNVANCVACHTVGKVASSGTQYHKSIATQPTTACASCHSSGLPTGNDGVPKGIVGPLMGDTSAIANMNHAATSTTECSTCHKVTGTRWSDGTFHSKVNAANVTGCVDCHYPRMPKTLTTVAETYTSSTGVVMPQHMSHTSGYITQDCTTCHATKGPVAGNAAPWKTAVTKLHAVVTQATFTTCLECHTTDKPASTVYYPSATANKRYAHLTQYRGDKDCFTCHTKKLLSNFVDTSKIGVAWSSGVYNHQDVNGKALSKGGGSCVNCHTGASGGFYKHENLGKTRWKTEMPCMTCHATAQF